MQIAQISTSFNPFGDTAQGMATCGSLASALSSLGHNVKIVVPLPRGMNPDAHSLARRLNPIEVEADSAVHSFARYDGHILSGVEVYLLEALGQADGVENSGPASIEAFCLAALSCLDSQAEQSSCCLSFDAATSAVPALCRARKIHHLMVVESLDRDPDDFTRSLLETDRAVVVGHNVQSGEEIPKPLSDMLQDGGAVTLPRPTETGQPLTPSDKASKKATFQMQSKLPVRTDVPLVFFTNPLDTPFIEALERFLTRDVQVMVATKNDRLSRLQERYPDRLAISTSDHPIEDHLSLADGCVVAGNPRIVGLALSFGTLPITGKDTGAGLVDLEPNLQSGSGIVVPHLSEDTLSEGLGRFAAAYADPTFNSLSSRLPKYALTWSRMATYCLQLIAELETDQAD